MQSMGILKVENNQVIFSEGNQFGSIICYRETEMLILTMHLKKISESIEHVKYFRKVFKYKHS